MALHMEYRIPEPKDNPISALVIFYKVCKGIQYDDRSWDKIHFGRCTKAAKEIFIICKDFETSKQCIEELADRFDSKDLSWTLETIVKNVHDWILEKGGRINVKQARTRFLHSLNEQRANNAIAFERNPTQSAILGTLRNIGIIQPESGPEKRNGMEVCRGVSGRTFTADVETPEPSETGGTRGDEQLRRIA